LIAHWILIPLAYVFWSSLYSREAQ
jgi:hypothetical protein